MDSNTGRCAPDTQLTEQVKQQTQQVVQQIPQKAGQLAEQARDQVKSQLAGQKERAAGGLESVAQALRQTGQHLHEQHQDAVGSYAETAADQVDRLSQYLRQRNIDQFIGEVERAARRRPAVFLGGALALGFLTARFLKSSRPDGEWERSGRGTDVGTYTSSARGGHNDLGAGTVASGTPVPAPVPIESVGVIGGSHGPVTEVRPHDDA